MSPLTRGCGGASFLGAALKDGTNFSGRCRYHQWHVVTKLKPRVGIADLDVAVLSPAPGDEDIVQMERVLSAPPLEVRRSRLSPVRLVKVRVIRALKTQISKTLDEPRVAALGLAVKEGVAIEVACD